MKKIVVGMDGSATARAALRWALDNSGADDKIVAVHAWQVPALTGMEATVLDPAMFQESAVALLEDAVDSAVENPDERARVDLQTRGGHSGTVLLEFANDADLVVVGSRGHGGFAALLLGSVTTYVVHHAVCPTVVVPVPNEN